MSDTATPTETAPAKPADVATPGGQQLPQTYTADQYHGLRGAYEQQLKEAKAALTQAKEQLGQSTETAKLLAEQKALLEPKVAEAETLAKKLAEVEGARTATDKLNGRLQTLIKYPNLLGPETMELVKTTTLEGEALEKVLGGLSAKLGAAPTLPAAAGGTPPQPPSTPGTVADMMGQADALLKEGKFDQWRVAYGKALALQEAGNPFKPPIDSVDQPGMYKPA